MKTLPIENSKLFRLDESILDSKTPIIEKSRLVPVAKGSKHISSPLIEANKYLIVYPTSKRGILRVIGQDDACHVTLDGNIAGTEDDEEEDDDDNITDNSTKASKIHASHMALYHKTGSDHSLLAVAFPNILVWKLPNRDLDSPDAISSPTPINLESSNTVSCLKFDPESGHLVTGCRNNGGGSHEIYLISVSEGPASLESKAKLTSPAIDISFSSINKNIFYVQCEDGTNVTWNISDQSLANSKFSSTVTNHINSFTLLAHHTKPLASQLLFNQAINVTILTSGLIITDCNSPLLLQNIDMATLTIRKVKFYHDFIILVDSRKRLLFVKPSKNIANNKDENDLSTPPVPSSISAVNTGLDILDIAVTKNLEKMKDVAFDVYIYHTLGVSILSVKKEELLAVNRKALQHITTIDTIDLSSFIGKPLLSSDSAATSSSPLLTPGRTASPVHPGTTKFGGIHAVGVSGKRNVSTPTNGSINAKQKRKNNTAISPQLGSNTPSRGSGDLLESYSRQDFEEKTYHLRDLLHSGKFVTKEMFEEMKQSHSEEIKKLEKRIDSLNDRLRKQQQKSQWQEEQIKKHQQKLNQPQSRRDGPQRLYDDFEIKSGRSPAVNATEPEDNEEEEESLNEEIGAEEYDNEEEGEKEDSRKEEEGEEEEEEEEEEKEEQDQGQSEEQDEELEEEQQVLYEQQLTNQPVQNESVEPVQSFEQAIYHLTTIIEDKGLFELELSDVLADYDYKTELVPHATSEYNRQLVILTAIACISLGIESTQLDTYTTWLIQLSEKVSPQLPEFKSDPNFLVSVLSQAKWSLRLFGSGNHLVNEAMAKLQNIIGHIAM